MTSTEPKQLQPLCDEEEFVQLLNEMVTDEAPRLFAVIHEYGDRLDAAIVAWGMAFEDRTDIATVHNGTFFSTTSPDRALHLFRRAPNIHPRLVWLTPTADDEAA